MKFCERKNAPVIVIPHDEMPVYHRNTQTLRKPVYVKFGKVVDGNPKAFTHERCCEYQICRVLYSDFTLDDAEVIDQAGNVWCVRFSNFKEWSIVEVA